jgi:hypothetical protein
VYKRNVINHLIITFVSGFRTSKTLINWLNLPFINLLEQVIISLTREFINQK